MITGLIGFPLGHSYSKIIHEMIVKEPYDLMPLNKEEFVNFMVKKEFDAINVTIPYKQEVLPYLDNIDDTAKRIGAVNTIVKQDNKLVGYNTDAFGFKWMIQRNAINIKGKKVAILGNGGATKAVQVVIHDLEALECLIVSRKESENTITYQDLYSNHSDVQVIVNATPVGMYPNIDECPIEMSSFKQLESAIDLIYNPWRTEFLLNAKDLGCKAVGGLEMLVAQAVKASELFRNIKIEDAQIDNIVKKIGEDKRNLIFIGMPGSGKSTIAKKYSKIKRMQLLDVDNEVEKYANKKIKDIFDEEGESQFRKLESMVIENLITCEKTIISCGGGIIKSMENVRKLQKMGLLIWIDRDIEKLCVSPSRPLSQKFSDVEKLYHERIHLYEKAADIRIENNEIIEHTIEEMHKALRK